jgi:4-amino-4-deoxy-L-arabinose transferase-like glycosyltransferase
VKEPFSDTRRLEPMQGRAGWVMAGVLAFAVLARWLGYTGFFGSDEVTYTDQAFKLLDGDWSVDKYVGSNRYGVNFPVALSALLLGRNELGAAAYSLLSSVAEVALLTWLAYRMFGARAALFAGLLLASLPTHVHFAGRLMADSPLSLTLTAAFMLFWEGEVRRSSLARFAAGCCLGLSFWIKPPLTVFAALVFMAYPLLARRLDWRWIWFAAGAATTVVLNCLAMWWMTGNFWYIFDAIRERQSSGYLQSGVSAGEIATGTGFYLEYLFGRIYHTGVLGYLMVLGLVLAWRSRQRLSSQERFGLSYTLLWAAGTLVVLTFYPASFNPLVFVPKQTNYMLVFVAPLCLLAGWALAGLSRRWADWILLAGVVVGLGFALLLQASVAVFTANSEATLRYVRSQPTATFYLMSNALRAASFQRLTQGADYGTRLHAIADLFPPTATAGAGSGASNLSRFAVVDEQTFAWDDSRPFGKPSAVPSCWVEVATLQGQPRGVGVLLMRGLASLPGLEATVIGSMLQRRATPLPARVYRVTDAGC